MTSKERQNAKINAILEEFDVEVESRCTQMKAHAEFLATSLRNSFQIELLRLPDKIRKMPLKQYNQMSKKELQQYVLRGALPSATPMKENIPNNQLSSTQSKNKITSDLQLELDDGIKIDLNDPNSVKSKLSSRAQKEALEKLKAIQDQVALMMRNLR